MWRVVGGWGERPPRRPRRARSVLAGLGLGRGGEGAKKAAFSSYLGLGLADGGMRPARVAKHSRGFSEALGSAIVGFATCETGNGGRPELRRCVKRQLRLGRRIDDVSLMSRVLGVRESLLGWAVVGSRLRLARGKNLDRARCRMIV